MATNQETHHRRHVRYECLEYASVRTEGHDLSAMIADVSFGGARFLCREPFRVGSPCIITVQRHNDEPLVLRATVRHSERTNDPEIFSTGIEFRLTTSYEEIAVAEFVHNAFQQRMELAAA